MVRSSLKKSWPPAALAALAALLVSVPVALAIGSNPTRAEYVEVVDPICKRNSEANSRILKGVKGQVKRGQLAPAGKRFLRAATALGKAVRQIAAVPQPSADKAKLSRWIDYLQRERTYLQKIGRYLKAGKKGRAQHEAVELNSNNSHANNTVVGFGFRDCRIESSRFL